MADIAAIAGGAVNRLWTLPLLASQLKACTLKVNPAPGVYDPASDTTALTWGASLSLRAFIYDRKREEKDASTQTEVNAPERAWLAKAVVRVSDMSGNEPDDRAVLVHGSDEWNVQGIEAPPGEAIYILSLRK